MVCFFRGIARSIRLGVPVSGHNYIPDRTTTVSRPVQVLRCTTCKHYSFAHIRDK